MHHPHIASIPCEIVADRSLASSLSSIAQTCAADMGLSIVLRYGTRPRGGATVTFHVPLTYVLEHDAAWFLAARVACFCPDARVAVVVVPMEAADTPDSAHPSRADAA